MGRELKRVRLDFNWPIGKIWHGYINPFYKHSKKCVACDGRGSSPETRLLESMWYGKVSRSFGRSNLSMFMDFLAYKAIAKNVNVVRVNEWNTTQINCLTGKMFDQKVELGDREIMLSEGLLIDRDLNSAINIYRRWHENHIAAVAPPVESFLSSVLERNNLLKEPVPFEGSQRL